MNNARYSLTYMLGINTVRKRTSILNNNVTDVIHVGDNMGKYKDTRKYVFIFMFEDILLTPVRSLICEI